MHRWLLKVPFMTVGWNMISAEKKKFFFSILLNGELQAVALPLPSNILLLCSFLCQVTSCQKSHLLISGIPEQEVYRGLVLINSLNIIHEPVCERRRGRQCHSELN